MFKFQASVWMKCESVPFESLKVLIDVLDRLFITFSRDVTKPSTLIYCKFCLRVCIRTEIHKAYI